jgi:hypothetical protein
MTADPPVCGGSGPTLRVLQTCERIRREEHCLCRFRVNDIVADLEAASAPQIAEWFTTALEPDDIPDLVRDVSDIHLERLDDDLAARIRTLLRDLTRLESSGAGLTDEFSDDLDD